MPRFAALASLSCAALLAAIPAAGAQNPVPATHDVKERVHTVAIELTRDGATLRVTRSLFNPTLFHSRVDLPIPLPCDALLDDFQVEERGAGGSSRGSRWKPAELLTPDDADGRFGAYLDATEDDSLEHVANADSAMLLSRNAWGCEAELSIYPLPPVQQRSFSYRVFIPSVYAEGRYTIELPSFDAYGLTPELEVAGLGDDSLSATVDQRELDANGMLLDGSKSHTVVLSPRDSGRANVRVVDLDVDSLVRSTPAALAQLEADASSLPRLHTAEFEAPAELASLPPVRRAVVLIDASRSLSSYEREELQRFGAAYFEALAEQDARVEVLLFDREVRRVYHDFVPAHWGAEDLPKLEIADANGSEVGQAIDHARDLLAEPTPVEGADWIIVLSDLYLRGDFDVQAEHEAADASAARVHVVRAVDHVDFAPAAADDPWTAVARVAGGMAWEASDGAFWADELVAPKRIWKLGLELEYADGSHRSEPLEFRFDAGAAREWADPSHLGAALTRASFVGEVWGQRRAWTGTPSELEGKRRAGALATHDERHDLSNAVRTAFAFHAQVISPFSSAWALAQFDGTAPALLGGFGSMGCFGGSRGFSTRCGGGIGCHAAIASPVDLATLAQQAVDHCQPRRDGSYRFETTDLEIVAVDSDNRCLAEATWATDISPTQSSGRKHVIVSHAGGLVTKVDVLAG